MNILKTEQKGSSRLELSIVVIIIVILSSVVIYTYSHVIKSAKSREAMMLLSNISKLQQVYYIESDRYSDNLRDIGYRPIIPLKYYTISIDSSSDQSFKATASGNLDSDPDLDIWTIDEKQILTHLSKD